MGEFGPDEEGYENELNALDCLQRWLLKLREEGPREGAIARCSDNLEFVRGLIYGHAHAKRVQREREEEIRQ